MGGSTKGLGGAVWVGEWYPPSSSKSLSVRCEGERWTSSPDGSGLIVMRSAYLTDGFAVHNDQQRGVEISRG